MIGAAGALSLVLAGCGGRPPSTLDGRSPEARRLAGAWWQMFGLAIGVYLVVGGFIVVAVVRRRRARAERAGAEDARDRRAIAVGGVLLPTVVLAVVAGITVDATRDVLGDPGGMPLSVQVIGHSWWWEVRYPDGGIVTANELRVPVGRPVVVTLQSVDVIHSFWVPELAGKVDMIPGVTTTVRFTAEAPGEYVGQCAEFCGLQHANMRFLVVAETPGAFERWRARRSGPARTEPTGELEARGRAVFVASSCAGCHTVRGTGANGTFGPDLTDFGSRRSFGALLQRTTPSGLRTWVTDAPSLKPGALMPPIELSDAEADAVVAYLLSLR